jgi:hypothetical protein
MPRPPVLWTELLVANTVAAAKEQVSCCSTCAVPTIVQSKKQSISACNTVPVFPCQAFFQHTSTVEAAHGGSTRHLVNCSPCQKTDGYFYGSQHCAFGSKLNTQQCIQWQGAPNYWRLQSAQPCVQKHCAAVHTPLPLVTNQLCVNAPLRHCAPDMRVCFKDC